MWMSLTLSVAIGLIPSQSAELMLTKVRTTYGILGAERPSNKILPGDNVVLSFNLEGAKVDDNGRLRYSIGMEVSNADGKVLFRQAPRDVETTVKPGAKSIPACASIQVGMDQPPGEYKLKVVVTDTAGGATQEVSRTYELLPKAFGLVKVSATTDREAQTPAGVLAQSKSAWINFSAVGFARGDANGQPNIKFAMQVLDESGNSALARSPSGEVNKDIPDKAHAVPGQFELILKKPGKYKIELKATDAVASQTATVTFPVTVAK